MKTIFASIALIAIAFSTIEAQKETKKFDEADYYKISKVVLPETAILEVGGLTALPNGNVALSTRRGDIYIVENSESDLRPRITKFAEGLNEILGLAYKDGYLYCAQRGELTKLIDSDKDGVADNYESFSSWALSGNYHEYTFGPKIDANGDFIITQNVGFSSENGKWYEATSRVPWRGWMLKIKKDGTIEPWSVGHRSPCGIFIHPKTNEYFYTDNQGDWMGSGGITHCEKGDFVGNPAGLEWTKLPNSPLTLSHSEFCKILGNCTYDKEMGLDIELNQVPDIGKPAYLAKKQIPSLKTQAIVLPHAILGQSTSDMIYLEENNKLAPYFAGQMLVGDQYASKIMRVSLEKVKGEYQGVAFDFRKDFESGILRFAFGGEGTLFVGMTNRGWGSIGKQPYGLQKLNGTGKIPFEMKDVKAMPDGFEIEYTMEVDEESATNPANYKITSFTYKYHSIYGSPIINDSVCKVKAAIISEDKKKIRLVVNGLRENYVHEIKATGVVSSDYVEILHPAAYYTLKNIPDGDKIKLSNEMQMHKHMHMQSMPMARKTEPQKPLKPAAKPTAPDASGGKNVNKQPASWTTIDKTINLGTRPGLMYDQQKITIKAGQKIKLVFVNNDDMQHNVVITKPGKADEIGETATNMGLEGPKMNYVPKSDNVLFHTKLVSPGTTETIYFEAPKNGGAYQIVCTYPGHYATMQSILQVNP